jgi:hypothetical protein
MARRWLNLVLALLVVGLGAAVWWTQRDHGKPKPPLTHLAQAAVKRIEIQRGSLQPIVLKRAGGHWRITEPVHVAADPFEVDQLLHLLALPRQQTFPASDVKLADLGLAPPHYRMQFNHIDLSIGNVESLSGHRYVQLDHQVALVENVSATQLKPGYAQFVSKQILPPGAKILTLALPGLTMTRAGESWKLDPAQPQADAGQMDRLAAGWGEASALWTRSAPAGAPAPKTAQAVTITLESGKTLHYTIVKDKPQLILERRSIGVRYALPGDDARSLLRLPPAHAKASSPAAGASSAKPAAAHSAGG